MLIVVTGGIGTGKSTVSQALADVLPGHDLVSADQLVRELYAQSEPFRQELIERFGTADRTEVSRIVFSDAAKRSDLVTLSWRYLEEVVDDLFERDNLIFEFPLYCESPSWHNKGAIVVVLSCDVDVQRSRVLARDGISADQFERIRASQMPVSVKLKLADVHVDTSGTLESVLQQVIDLRSKLYAMAVQRGSGRSRVLHEKAQRDAGQEERLS